MEVDIFLDPMRRMGSYHKMRRISFHTTIVAEALMDCNAVTEEFPCNAWEPVESYLEMEVDILIRSAGVNTSSVNVLAGVLIEPFNISEYPSAVNRLISFSLPFSSSPFEPHDQ